MPTCKSALSPQTWPFELALLPETAYLVGGSVRDALLGRQAEYLDLDFVLPHQAVETARSIAQQCKAGFVVLDAQHQIARVVFPKATVDFAQQLGNSLETDLQRRDFTINAIAYHPHTETLLDPLNGHQDLQQHRLRMIAPDNLAEDPLRLLRAYRQAAQLGFEVESLTQGTIRQLAPLINRVAAERVRGEIDCLLSFAAGTVRLQQAWKDGVLSEWLPHTTADCLTTLHQIDLTYERLRQEWPDYAQLLTGWIREQTAPGLHRSWLKAAKLSQLLSDQLDVAEAELTRLKYSRAEQQAILALLKGWHMLQAGAAQGGLSRREQYSLFKATGANVLGVGLLGLAKGVDPNLVMPLLQRYLDPQDPVAHPQTLVTGRDLMQVLHLRPGPHIGQLLEGIQIAQAEGKISSREEALAWAKAQG